MDAILDFIALVWVLGLAVFPIVMFFACLETWDDVWMGLLGGFSGFVVSMSLWQLIVAVA